MGPLFADRFLMLSLMNTASGTSTFGIFLCPGSTRHLTETPMQFTCFFRPHGFCSPPSQAVSFGLIILDVHADSTIRRGTPTLKHSNTSLSEATDQPTYGCQSRKTVCKRTVKTTRDRKLQSPAGAHDLLYHYGQLIYIYVIQPLWKR